jgi:hypothetical protein
MLEKIHVTGGERMQLAREASTFKDVGHFGIAKIIANLQR